jgi:hypothetical protein
VEGESDFKSDLVGAALIIILGIVVVVVGVGYRLGALTNMGAGYVPTVIGTLMIFVGVLIAVTARASRAKAASPDALLPEVGKLPHAPGDSVIQWRGWACILGGVAAFVIAGEHLGLAPAIFSAVFLSALGDRTNSWRDCFLLALGMTIAGVAIFSFGLKLTFPLFTWA